MPSLVITAKEDEMRWMLPWIFWLELLSFYFFMCFFLGRVGEYDLLVIRVVCDIFYLICAFVISSHYVLICNSDFDKSLFLLLNSLHNLLI